MTFEGSTIQIRKYTKQQYRI